METTISGCALERKSYDDYHVLIEGLVVIYTLPKGAKRNYYVRIKHPKIQKRYIVKSLKTENKESAIDLALSHYSKIKLADDLGLDVEEKGFNSRIQQFLKWRSRVKNQTSTTYRNIFNRHFSVYFKSNKDIRAIKTQTISDYWAWRCDRWNNSPPKMLTDKNGLRRPSFAGYKNAQGKMPSYTTMEHETRILNMFFDWCVDKGYLQRQRLPEVYNPITKKIEGSNYMLRGYFSADEFMSVRAKLAGKARTKGRRGNHRYKKLYAWVLFSTAVMARPQEIKRMTFGMVKKVRIQHPPTEEDYEHHEWKIIHGKAKRGSKPEGKSRLITEIEIPASISKVKPDNTQKGRIIIPFNGVKCWERIHESWRQEWAKHYGREPSDNDYLFPKWGKDKFNQVCDMNRAFTRFLEEPDVNMRYDSQGRSRGSYALRKYAISIALSEGSSMVAVSANSGSTIATLQKYYVKNTARDYADDLLRDRDYLTKRIRFVVDDE